MEEKQRLTREELMDSAVELGDLIKMIYEELYPGDIYMIMGLAISYVAFANALCFEEWTEPKPEINKN